MTAEEQWRDIPGFGGMYQINLMGDVRTWRWRLDRKMKKPRPMSVFRKRDGNAVVKLTKDGQAKEYIVMNLMVSTFYGSRPDGLCAYHINGRRDDNRLSNIGFGQRNKIAKKTGPMAETNRPIAKLNKKWEVVEYYRSSRVAAKANGCSYQTILDRCNHRVKYPYRHTGYNYLFADEVEKFDD